MRLPLSCIGLPSYSKTNSIPYGKILGEYFEAESKIHNCAIVQIHRGTIITSVLRSRAVRADEKLQTRDHGILKAPPAVALAVAVAFASKFIVSINFASTFHKMQCSEIFKVIQVLSFGKYIGLGVDVIMAQA
ncbi:hypothetical protein CCR75_000975 [Bremia lactucae]|uniref:Uncharacterized protein n=1 Tax=Bremia lactucae TaxID=4779 RepID=A0A976FEG4_BRELC|nr:hypothetical protein CCR75_000975 [Bremia lactucae]